MSKDGYPWPIREALGRAHYERMRIAMLPTLAIDPWEQLRPASREAYRRHMDYLVPALAALINTLTTDQSSEEAAG